MASGEGYWANYSNGKCFPVDEHENWLRRGNNAEKIGVPAELAEEFSDYVPQQDRNKFLLTILDKTYLMRVRDHGEYATFEFSNRNIVKPLAEILIIAESPLGLGDYSTMHIINFATREEISISYEEFKDQYAGNEDRLSDLKESVLLESISEDQSFRNFFPNAKLADNFDWNELRD